MTIQSVAVALASGGVGAIYASTATALDGWPATLTLVSIVVVVVGLSVALAVVFLVGERRQLVSGVSVALKQLDDLNSRFRTLVPVLPPIQLAFRTSVNSKAKLDRFDLFSLMGGSILERELWVEREIEVRLAATGAFGTYDHYFEALGDETLGRSSHPRVSDERFAAIERKLFQRRKLTHPTPRAQITTTVRYTSPKGQNSYSRQLEWDFDQLRQGLLAAQATRARQSTAEALRQRERSLMNPGLRMKILRRDGFRCRMCGASASDGTSLHIDHITPVSRGGRTTAENLQTLCQTCNIGKSNKFIG